MKPSMQLGRRATFDQPSFVIWNRSNEHYALGELMRTNPFGRFRRAALGIVFVPSLLFAQKANTSTAPGTDAITAAKMRADLEFLSGDWFRGRLTNTPENAIALEWMKARFQWLGLEPMGSGGTFFQHYDLSIGSLASGNDLAVTRGGATTHYALASGFYPHRYSASGTATGDVVFAHFGISAPRLGYEDLGGDLRGKILVVLDHEPGETDSTSMFDGVVTSEFTNPLKKALAAQARGAAGVLFVTDVQNHQNPQSFEAATRGYWPEQPPRLLPYTLAAWSDRLTIPVGQISVPLADSLVRAAGTSLLDLARASETTRGAPPVPLPGVRVAMTTAVVRTAVPDRNVLAAIKGSDPRLKDEWIVISGHVDHNGADATQIFNGADDNGSGAVALLAIAEAYAKAAAAGQRPKRSVLFAAFNSEERGPLMGSWGYVETPAVPLAKTAAMLNMDMIGRNEEVPENGGARFRGLPVQTGESNQNTVTLLGWSRSAQLTAAVERANAGYGLTLKKNYDNNISQLLRRSDSWPFLQHDVPAIWFHTGLHPDYHLTTDRADRINYPKMERIARLVHETSWDLAQAAGRPVLNKR
jgi:Zn-dependent M28 family amino/carboxypeptidase